MSAGHVYHVWFATRRRKWLVQGDVEDRAKAWLLEIAAQCGIDLLAVGTMVDHVHLLIRVRNG